MSRIVVEAARSASAALPRIHVLGTGGTIAAAADGLARGSYKSGALPAEALCAAVPGLSAMARISCEQVSTGGSQDMSEDIWLKLARAVETASADDDIAGIVITHGTDTMEETAFFLSLVVPPGKPVILTGATRPTSAPGADGPANLADAVAVAVDPQASGRGVMVVYDSTILDPRSVVRTQIRSARDFGAVNGGPVGLVGANGVCFLAPALSATPRFPIPDAPLPPVAVIFAHVGVSPAMIDAAIAAGARGVVWAGTGNGNASAAVIAALAAASHDGIAVVRASRIVGSGYVERNVEIDDDRYGFLVSGDLDAFKARILLQFVLAAGIVDPGSRQAAFAPFHPQATRG